MIRIDPDTLYTREDLVELLAPLGIDWDGLCARLRPRRVSRMVYRGKDILAAWDCAPALSERPGVAMPPAANRGNRRRRGANVEAIPGAKLRAFRKELLAVRE